MSLEKAVNEMYRGRERLILIGLTGRTGSGCSKVASILQKESIEKLDIKKCKEYDFETFDERKNRVIFEYMKQEGKWNSFSVIEVSSIILSCAFEQGEDKFIDYINKITIEEKQKTISIGDKRKVIDAIRQMGYMSEACNDHSLNNLDVEGMNDDKLKDYFQFYTKEVIKLKNRFKNILNDFSCFEVYSDKMNGKRQSKYHLYTFLLQQMGNNIRCSGNPFDDTFSVEQSHVFVKRIDKIIKIIIKYNELLKKQYSRICIDAIRNPYEAMYFRDKYRAFHLMAVSTDDFDRKERLKDLNTEELLNLDKIEYAQKLEKPQEIFYHQNIQGCIQCADIHIYNPNVNNNKFFTLTEQILKYVCLMLHPGLVTPTNVERCMQLAYNAKYNSGCLSRQVGAVVTREDFSIQSVGWNDVPKGQVSCNLRDVHTFCKNKDSESYSEYEVEDEKFSDVLVKLGEKTNGKTCGRCMAFCFKDVYNGLNNDKNQVYTRALHAEENAFLQISKYGGTHVRDGVLFTTASPCELCAKKAYQLGIKSIYYIDPYPGISQKHILKFGKYNNPDMKLFFGAIGQAYLDFYEPRISTKDELELLTGVNVKNVASGKVEAEEIKYEDISYNEMIVELKFDGDRNKIESTREVRAHIQKEKMDHLTKKIIWTGSAYDGTEIVTNNSDPDLSLEETCKEMPYTYTIRFKEQKKRGDKIHYTIKTMLKDEKHVMEPYLAHMVKNDTKKLVLRIIAPLNMIEKVKFVIYADLDMKTKIQEEMYTPKESDDRLEDIIEYSIKKANVNYTYAIEWNFKDNQ